MAPLLLNLIRADKTIFTFLVLSASTVFAQVSTTPSPGALPIVANDRSVTLVVETTAWPGVTRAVHDLAQDIHAVTDLTPEITQDLPRGGDMVLVASLGHSPLLDQLAAEHKINLAPLRNQWEATLSQTIEHPFPGIHSALVIAGS